MKKKIVHISQSFRYKKKKSSRNKGQIDGFGSGI